MPVLKPIQLHASPKSVFLAGKKPVRMYSEAEFEAMKREAYHAGAEETSRLMERQMLEQRGEMVRLQSETLAALAAQHAALVRQIQEALPELTIEAAARVLAQTVFDRAAVLRIVEDLLAEIAPGPEQLEVQLAPCDIEAIAGYDTQFREKHPAISFRANAELRAGDCVVRSRFGVLDGRLGTKLRALEEFFK
jgi:flagellar biosynthesis/type III secretory pathway protein FliH